eukprot:gene25490-30597_t
MFKKILAGFTSVALLAAAPAWSAAPAPARDNMSHALAVTGVVETPLTLKVAGLRLLPPGVRLRDILDKAVLDAPGHNDVKKLAIIATATDGYAVVFSWGELYNAPAGEGVIVYYEKNGKALDDSDGEIALISAKDIRTGPRHVKWLNAIEVRKLVE